MNRRVAILGGGFAGLRACHALRRSGVEVVLIDPRDEAVMIPALPDLACGLVCRDMLVRSRAELLPRGVLHLPVAVEWVDLDARTLSAGGEEWTYDQLLITCGSKAVASLWDDDADGPVYSLDSIETAEAIHAGCTQYLQQAPSPHVLVAGGGYTGLELAAGLSLMARQARVDCRITVADASAQLLPFLSRRQRERVQRALDCLGVELLSGARVQREGSGGVKVGAQRIEPGLICWAAGSERARVDIRGAISTLRDGRIRVRPDLSVPGYPEVFVAGDAAAFEHRGVMLRQAVNFAWYGGSCAGKNLIRQMRGQPTRPFRPFDAGWVIPLQVDSVGQIFSSVRVCGKPGLRLHYLMCGLRNFSFRNFCGFARIAAGPLHNKNPEPKGATR